MSALAGAAETAQLGPGLDPQARSSGRWSPPSSTSACMGYIESGRDEGAELWREARRR